MTSEPIHPIEGRSAEAADVTAEPTVAEKEARRRWLRRVLPLVAIAAGVLVSWLLFATRPTPRLEEPAPRIPLVRVVTVSPQAFEHQVVAHGTVLPRTESDLVAEVRGRVMSVSPALVVGGFFERGEELLRLDDREHRISVDQARATVRLRESEAKLARAEARRGQELARRGAASAAELEAFESRALVADAQLAAARAALAQGELDLDRTVLRAPFPGRVRERTVDIGQFVNPGSKLGRIQAIDAAEVHLPIPTDDLAYLDLPLDFAPSAAVLDDEEGALVTLTAELGGREISWPARLVRTDGEIDLRTRTLNVVARVEDPYNRGLRAEEPIDATAGEQKPASVERPVSPAAPAPPLPSGLFVEAQISGRALEEVFVLPLSALRDGSRVFLVDDAGDLEIRDVVVARRDRDHFVVESGIEPGERIIVSPLPLYTRGMTLHPVEDDS